MTILEKDILNQLEELEADEVNLCFDEPITFYKDGELIKTWLKIDLETTAGLVLELLSEEEARQLYNNRHIKCYYQGKRNVYTITCFVEPNVFVVRIKKGKFDLFPNTTVIIPQVKVGNEYYRSKECEKWIVAGFENDNKIKFLINKGKGFKEEDIDLICFLEKLRSGEIHEVNF